MQMKKKCAAALCLFLCVTLLCGACAAPVAFPTTPEEAQSAAEPAGAEPQDTGVAVVSASLQDMAGRQVSVAGVPERIVSLSPSSTEILFALGAGDRLVGVDEGSNYPEQARTLTRVGGADAPDVAAIEALSPQVVFAGDDLQTQIMEELTQKGISVVCAEAAAYEDVYTSIALIAQITGTEAVELVTNMRQQVQQLKDTVAQEEPNAMTVYYVMGFGGDGNRTGGPGTLIHDCLRIAGGNPAVTDTAERWPRFETEEVVAMNPDILLVADYVNMDDLCAAEGYCELAAVREGRVYSVNAELVERPGPRIVEGMEQIHQLLVQARIS